MSVEQKYGKGKLKLGLKETLQVIYPYAKSKVVEQIKSVWFIIAYLIFFQIVVLKLPIVYSITITFGVVLVILGLAVFMEGLEIGLMPFGEIIGSILPKKASMKLILGFAVLLGFGATLAEPSIAVLKLAGAGVLPEKAPLLYSLLNDFTTQLVLAVGSGVGVAVLLGVLRFMYGWSLKKIIIPLVTVIATVTIWAHFQSELSSILGLAWDCGAVTTGPVTVPLVLALGIGISRVINSGGGDNSGFGVVTLASLFPIAAVLILGVTHVALDDYYGRPNYKGDVIVQRVVEEKKQNPMEKQFTMADFEKIKAEKKVGEMAEVIGYQGGEFRYEDGKIIQKDAAIVYEKKVQSFIKKESLKYWNTDTNVLTEMKGAMFVAMQAIIPLGLFLFLTLRFVLRTRLDQPDILFTGILFCVVGMAIFMMGISVGLTPLGGQLGSNVPGAFTNIVPWQVEGVKVALFEGDLGKFLAALFAFFLGFGATLAEPALNALGMTVEKITTGAFKKSLLMNTVATGVGIGLSLGVLKIAYNIPLTYMLIPPYAVLLVLTFFSSEQFVNFGWDSAGVTTGPITVPLVLSMGLGIGANIPGVMDGFGVLALASVMPILTVLTVGYMVDRAARKAES